MKQDAEFAELIIASTSVVKAVSEHKSNNNNDSSSSSGSFITSKQQQQMTDGAPNVAEACSAATVAAVNLINLLSLACLFTTHAEGVCLDTYDVLYMCMLLLGGCQRGVCAL